MIFILPEGYSKTDVKISTPIGGDITVRPEGKTLKLVYNCNGVKTVYYLKETSKEKLIMTK